MIYKTTPVKDTTLVFSGITRTMENCQLIGLPDPSDWLPKPKYFARDTALPDSVRIIPRFDTSYVLYIEPPCPNPFNTFVRIRYSLSTDAWAVIRLYDKPYHVIWEKNFDIISRYGSYELFFYTYEMGIKTPGLYRLVISATSKDGRKYNESFGDLLFEPR